jgi:hypothetical protein
MPDGVRNRWGTRFVWENRRRALSASNPCGEGDAPRRPPKSWPSTPGAPLERLRHAFRLERLPGGICTH